MALVLRSETPLLSDAEGDGTPTPLRRMEDPELFHVLPSRKRRRTGNMAPPPARLALALARRRRKKAPITLDEDEYTDAMDAIIERDFFPDLPAMKARLQSMDSILSGGGGRTSTGTAGGRGGWALGDGGEQTPQFGGGGGGDSYRGGGDGDGDGDGDSDGDSDGNSDGEPRTLAAAVSRSLDDFHAKYTSEDNASFEVLHEQDRVAHQEKYWWVYDQERANSVKLLTQDGRNVVNLQTEQTASRQLEDHSSRYGKAGASGCDAAGRLIRDRQRDAAGDGVALVTGTDNRKKAPDGWTYRVRNSLMFPPNPQTARLISGLEPKPLALCDVKDGTLDLSASERKATLTKGLKYRATRFTAPGSRGGAGGRGGGSGNGHGAMRPGHRPWSTESSGSVSSTGSSIGDPRAPHNSSSKPKSPNVRGFGFVSTPAPGELMSPMTTWGEVQGTPLLLGPGDTPLNSGVFRVSAMPDREAQGHLLHKTAQNKRTQHSSRSGSRSGSGSSSSSSSRRSSGSSSSSSKGRRRSTPGRASQYTGHSCNTGGGSTPGPDFSLMSPAAQALARRVHGGGGSTGLRATPKAAAASLRSGAADRSLRASYRTTTPRSTPGATPRGTPRGTPRARATPRSTPRSTPIGGAGKGGEGGSGQRSSARSSKKRAAAKSTEAGGAGGASSRRRKASASASASAASSSAGAKRVEGSDGEKAAVISTDGLLNL